MIRSRRFGVRLRRHGRGFPAPHSRPRSAEPRRVLRSSVHGGIARGIARPVGQPSGVRNLPNRSWLPRTGRAPGIDRHPAVVVEHRLCHVRRHRRPATRGPEGGACRRVLPRSTSSHRECDGDLVCLHRRAGRTSWTRHCQIKFGPDRVRADDRILGVVRRSRAAQGAAKRPRELAIRLGSGPPDRPLAPC